MYGPALGRDELALMARKSIQKDDLLAPDYLSLPG
jgi:hypothetical protein